MGNNQDKEPHYEIRKLWRNDGRHIKANSGQIGKERMNKYDNQNSDS